MADKKQFDGSETSKKSKSLLFSLSQAKPASTAEAETSANQSLLYTLWKSVSGKFAKPAQPQEEKPAAQEPEAELFEDDHPLARLRRAWSQEQAASRGDNTDSDQAPFGPQDLLDGGELLPVHRRLIEQAARLSLIHILPAMQRISPRRRSNEIWLRTFLFLFSRLATHRSRTHSVVSPG